VKKGEIGQAGGGDRRVGWLTLFRKIQLAFVPAGAGPRFHIDAIGPTTVRTEKLCRGFAFMESLLSGGLLVSRKASRRI
jgi:hypothetical protein